MTGGEKDTRDEAGGGAGDRRRALETEGGKNTERRLLTEAEKGRREERRSGGCRWTARTSKAAHPAEVTGVNSVTARLLHSSRREPCMRNPCT